MLATAVSGDPAITSDFMRQTESQPDASHALSRSLGAFDATCVVVGAIIGVGIFLNPGQVARVAGSADMALAAWALGGVIAMVGALTFASLGSLYHGPGAQYDVLRDAYGAAPAFLFVHCNAIIQAGAIAVISVICADNIGVMVNGDSLAPSFGLVLSLILIAALMAANYVGVRWGAGVQNATVVAKVATLLAITVIAALAPTNAPVSTSAPAGASGAKVLTLFAAVVPAFFAYGGWQHALWIAGEVRRPERNIPFAILVGVTLVVGVYLLVNWAYLKLLGFNGVTSGGGALAANAVAQVLPEHAKRLIAGAVSVSAFGVLNAQLLSGPRLIYRMAADGRFFRAFSVTTSFGSPGMAILLLGALAIALLICAGPARSDAIVSGVVFLDGIFFVLTALAIFRLPARREGRLGLARRFGYPIVPILFALGELGVLIGALSDSSQRNSALTGLVWLTIGVLLFVALFRRRHWRDDAIQADS